MVFEKSNLTLTCRRRAILIAKGKSRHAGERRCPWTEIHLPLGKVRRLCHHDERDYDPNSAVVEMWTKLETLHWRSSECAVDLSIGVNIRGKKSPGIYIACWTRNDERGKSRRIQPRHAEERGGWKTPLRRSSPRFVVIRRYALTYQWSPCRPKPV